MAGWAFVIKAVDFIAIDWGASQLRVFYCDFSDTAVPLLRAQQNGPGVSACQGNFQPVLHDLLAPYLQQHPTTAVYMAGHITSSLGWFRTEYLACPFAPARLAPAIRRAPCPDMQLYVSPGLSCTLPQRPTASMTPVLQDVMRGEEVQLLGLLAVEPALTTGRHLVCLPGTHTKWVWLQDGNISYFRTSPLGELYALLCQHSVLFDRAPPAQWCEQSFSQGLQAATSPASQYWLHQLFGVRTLQLCQQMNQTQASAYLSGLLVGADVEGMAALEQLTAPQQILLAANSRLQACYQTALQQRQYQVSSLDIQTLTLAGFQVLARYPAQQLRALPA